MNIEGKIEELEERIDLQNQSLNLLVKRVEAIESAMNKLQEYSENLATKGE